MSLLYQGTLLGGWFISEDPLHGARELIRMPRPPLAVNNVVLLAILRAVYFSSVQSAYPNNQNQKRQTTRDSGYSTGRGNSDRLRRFGLHPPRVVWHYPPRLRPPHGVDPMMAHTETC